MIVQVRLTTSRRAWYADAGSLILQRGEMVIVDVAHGFELGKVIALHPHSTPQLALGNLTKVVRRAQAEDVARMQQLARRHEHVMRIGAQKIEAHGLPMRLVKVAYNVDGSRLTLFFTAEQRVDFRLLVRDLAATFRTRIELRQVSPREKAQLLGGIGRCGRPFCCSLFGAQWPQPTLRMARDQGLPMHATKISGGCNRLLCCLAYEHQHYQALQRGLPTRGAIVQTPDGMGEVVQVNVLHQSVTVQLFCSGMHVSYPVASIAQPLVSPPGQDHQEGDEQ